ncbi:peroxiredoxin-like family protein [Aspergillus lucknowensis]|uniref:AhpC/TSA antioxidant enzyme-domain-containing protein n=1 Tax=Aspergillus lucknowensis TaxID=176173 RepID=A0ABR4LCB0_9EURO
MAPVTDELPSPEAQAKAAEYTVFDREGKEHRFQDLYNKNGPGATDRTLIIFVRHFFCCSCQEFLQHLSQSITPEYLSHLPHRTSIAVIGCGEASLIDFYAQQTNCPYPIYCDPGRKLYDELGMIKTWEVGLGSQTGYISKSLLRQVVEGVWQGLRHIPSGKVLKGGPSDQVGGEFLFESGGGGEGKRVTWCHRMASSRGHTEIPGLAGVLSGGEVPEGFGGARR